MRIEPPAYSSAMNNMPGPPSWDKTVSAYVSMIEQVCGAAGKIPIDKLKNEIDFISSSWDRDMESLSYNHLNKEELAHFTALKNEVLKAAEDFSHDPRNTGLRDAMNVALGKFSEAADFYKDR